MNCLPIEATDGANTLAKCVDLNPIELTKTTNLSQIFTLCRHNRDIYHIDNFHSLISIDLVFQRRFSFLIMTLTDWFY